MIFIYEEQKLLVGKKGKIKAHVLVEMHPSISILLYCKKSAKGIKVRTCTKMDELILFIKL